MPYWIARALSRRSFFVQVTAYATAQDAIKNAQRTSLPFFPARAYGMHVTAIRHYELPHATECDPLADFVTSVLARVTGDPDCKEKRHVLNPFPVMTEYLYRY